MHGAAHNNTAAAISWRPSRSVGVSSSRAQDAAVADRMLTEREAFRAARYFLEQFNERERSDAIALLIGWMEEGWWDHDPSETFDPAQWADWTASVDRVLADRAGS
jgi:hypothetical protein